MYLWLFWLIAAVLTAMVALVLIQALRRGASAGEEASDIKVYRDQLAEVDRDLARGTLAAEEAQRLRIEVSRRLLEADRSGKRAVRPAAQGSLIWAGALVLAMLGGSLWLYTRLGTQGYADMPLSFRLAVADETYKNRPSQATVEAGMPPGLAADPEPEFLALMEKLREAVKARPDDAVGLELLARNEGVLGNYAAARDAQKKLLEIKGDSATPDQRLMLAQIMIAAAGGYVSPEAEVMLVDVLERDPQNGMARYLMGLMFAEVGRPDRAFQIWQPLLAEGPPDAPWVQAVMADIEAVADQAGIKFSLPTGKGPSAADMAAAGDMTADDRQAMIAGMVGQLEERLFAESGPLEEWLKLINALKVLGEPDRGRAALKEAEAALAADPAALQAVREAAAAAGFTP